MPTKVSIKKQFNRDIKQLKKKYPTISSDVRKLGSVDIHDINLLWT
jgi:mRNA-degrading endonuclease YafQ of YafQ-DinJ toxin-antitoxin module